MYELSDTLNIETYYHFNDNIIEKSYGCFFNDSEATLLCDYEDKLLLENEYNIYDEYDNLIDDNENENYDKLLWENAAFNRDRILEDWEYELTNY